jgi:predicted nucleic acid-binding protein
MTRSKHKPKESTTTAKTEYFVFDACTLIAFFNDEVGADKTEQLIERARMGEIQVYCMSINVYEVYYDTLRHNDLKKAEELLNDIYDLPFTIIESIDRAMMRDAGYFKIKYKMSVADSFALALAKQLDAKIVTTDHHEFDPIEKDDELQFFWLR